MTTTDLWSVSRTAIVVPHYVPNPTARCATRNREGHLWYHT
jgi:hypothetical protein